MMSGVENNAGPNVSGVTGVAGFRGVSFLAFLLESSFSLNEVVRFLWTGASGRVMGPSGFSLGTEVGLTGAAGAEWKN